MYRSIYFIQQITTIFHLVICNKRLCLTANATSICLCLCVYSSNWQTIFFLLVNSNIQFDSDINSIVICKQASEKKNDERCSVNTDEFACNANSTAGFKSGSNININNKNNNSKDYNEMSEDEVGSKNQSRKIPITQNNVKVK